MNAKCTQQLLRIVWLPLLVAAPPGGAEIQLDIESYDEVVRTEEVISISAVSNENIKTPFQSGVWVAYSATGKVEFIGPADEATLRDPNAERFRVQESLQLERPTAIAEVEGTLYVWDAGQRKLLALDTVEGRQRTLSEDRRLQRPRFIVASPERYVIVFDEAAEGVFWLRDRGGEHATLHEARVLSNLAEPLSAAFVSWDTLAVLEGATNAIIPFGIEFYGDKLGVFELEPMRLSDRNRAGGFTAIAAKDGTLYVASRDQVFTYVVEAQELMPATPPGVFTDIRQIAVGSDNLFVLEGDQLNPIPKSIPVEIDLDAGPAESQTALMQLYLYLDRIGLLPTRELRAGRAYTHLGDFLLEQKVLIAPHERTVVKFLPRWIRSDTYTRPELVDAQHQFGYWFCRQNRTFCGDTPPIEIFDKPVEPLTTIVVPGLETRSNLRRRTVQLAQSVQETLDATIFAVDLKKQVTFDVLKRLNRLPDNTDPRKFYATRRGTVTLPYESWAVAVAVPARDYYERATPLMQIASAERITMYSLEVYTKQSAYSTPDPVDPAAAAADCATLTEAQEALWDAIGYPRGQLTDPSAFGLDDVEVAIGIIEKQSQVKDHAEFTGADGVKAWYQMDGLGLSAETVPQTITAGWKPRIGSFEQVKHHGTHVAALIGGRAWPCWRGLLPRSRLVLIDATGPGSIASIARQAEAAGVKVFNVSQRLDRGPGANEQTIQALKDLMTKPHEDMIFVVAAGNGSLDLNNAAVVPVPAEWGKSHSVVTVTSTGLIEANTGKKYVDLMTTGVNVMSATEGTDFDVASGTSQAAPLVTAAAAFLIDPSGAGQTPGDIKARLIATATWNPAEHENKVWGGRFDFGDAIRFHDKHILQTSSEGEKIFSLVRPNPSARLQLVGSAQYYERDTDGAFRFEPIRQESILSLRRNDDNVTFRVVLKDRDGWLKILLNAQLQGQLKFGGLEEYKHDEQRFVRVTDGTLSNSRAINVIEISEYVAKMPYQVRWL